MSSSYLSTSTLIYKIENGIASLIESLQSACFSVEILDSLLAQLAGIAANSDRSRTQFFPHFDRHGDTDCCQRVN